MKRLGLLILILFSFNISFAQIKEQLSEKEKARREKNIQAGNPFKRFGYKPKIATLSKGKYLEFHDLDTIMRIGSFVFNTRQKKITGYVNLDTVHSEATFNPQLISRWFSPDPLSEEYPSWSPYNFTMNNPIRFIDPDGKAVDDAICCNFTGSFFILFWRQSKIKKYKQQGHSVSEATMLEVRDELKIGARYLTPIEDIYGLITGKDFDGNNYNRVSAGAWAIIGVIPGAKLGKLNKLLKLGNASKFEKFIGFAKLEGAGAESLQKIVNKVNNIGDHLKSHDITGAILDISGNPVKIGNKTYNHLGEVNDALRGLGNQLKELNKLIESGDLSNDVLNSAKSLRRQLQKQKDNIQNVLNKAKKEVGH